MHDLLALAAAHHQGRTPGIYSVCSAHPSVLAACMRQGLEDGSPVLVEATCNQVNQDGGYTGMTPQDFAAYARGIALQVQFPIERLRLGGDHLGINPWQNLPADQAMHKARVMTRDYVLAGFRKIHLDASMHSASDDPQRPLPPERIAHRAAELCAVAEATHAGQPELEPPVYVVGTEVPPPGGAKSGDGGLQVTDPVDAQETLAIFREAFLQRGLYAAWERVIALVVQPGVEFGDQDIHRYDPAKAAPLSAMIAATPGLVFEAHSTDYQTPSALRRLVRDHFAILKVGPELTFAFREAVFALAHMEQELAAMLAGMQPSAILAVIEQVMEHDPQYWRKYYPGGAAEQAFARKYSLSDRIRYYWPRPQIQQSLNRLLDNLRRTPPPLALLHQYLPGEALQVAEGGLPNDPEMLIQAHIGSVARKYTTACREDGPVQTA